MQYDFPKLIELDEYTKFSEPTLQIVRPRDISVPHIKVASEALDYIKHVQPQPGKTIILVLAMTAGEYYGANRNGDAWSERPLLAGGRTRITADEVLPKHYKTYETNAKVFRHHINKDPAKSIGEILKAFYNWDMHRVELLLALSNLKAEDTVQQIEEGKFPAVSMGCKIKYDVCDICGNMAPSRAQYCDHARYKLGQYLPNGKQVKVWNPSPRFFDLSCVRRPADRVGFMMKKVAGVPEVWSSAELGERIQFLQDKMSDARKMSVINKVIRGDAVAAKEDDGDLNVVKDYADQVAKPAAREMPPLDDSIIQEMVQHRPAEVLSTLASMGIFLTTPEFIKFFLWKAVPGLQIPTDLLQRAVDAQQLVFEVLAQIPDLVEEVQNTDFLNLSPDNVDPSLVARFSPLLEKRSQSDDYMRQRLVDSALSQQTNELDPGQGYWDTLEIVDPRTGERYRTTRGAVLDAKKALPKARFHTSMRNLLGSGALLSGAYKLFGARVPDEYMAREYSRAAQAPYPYISTTGEQVPVGTELAKVSMNLKGAIMQLTHDWSTTSVSSREYRKMASGVRFGPDMATACFDTMADWLGKVICP